MQTNFKEIIYRKTGTQIKNSSNLKIIYGSLDYDFLRDEKIKYLKSMWNIKQKNAN